MKKGDTRRKDLKGVKSCVRVRACARRRENACKRQVACRDDIGYVRGTHPSDIPAREARDVAVGSTDAAADVNDLVLA
jgi:hypothetical protein